MVTRGSVSSIRRDGIVQLDTNLNPGNSGGPIVDTTGRLVGIAFARPQGGKEVITGIGLAIQPVELTRFLEGRVADSSIISKKVMDSKAEIEIEVALLDPLERIKAIRVYYLSADKVNDKKPLSSVKGVQQLELAVKDQKAGGKFTVETAKPGVISYFCQASWGSGGGKTLAAKPLPFHVNYPSKVAPKRDLVVLETARPGGYNVVALSFSPNGERLACANHSSEAHLFDLATGWKSVTLQDDPKNGIYSVGLAFSPDGKRLAYAREGGSESVSTLSLLEASPGKVIHQLEDKSDGRFEAVVAFSPDGRLLALGATDEVIFLDAAAGKRMEGMTIPRAGFYTSPIRCLGFSPDGKRLAGGGRDGHVRLWDVATRKEVASFPLKDDRVQCLAWSPDGKTLAAGSFNGKVKLWDVPARKERAELKLDKSTVYGISFNSDGTLLATGSGATVRLWHVAGAREIALLPKGALDIWTVQCVAFSPDDQYLAVGKGNRLYVLDVQQVLERFPSKK